MVKKSGKTITKNTKAQVLKQTTQSDNLAWVENHMGITEDGKFMCQACHTSYDDWNGLSNHAKRVHDISKSITALSTSLASKESTVSVAEQGYVKLIKDKTNQFLCIGCATPSVISFCSCEKHFMKSHGVRPETVKTFICFKLGQAVKNKNFARQAALYKVLQHAVPEEMLGGGAVKQEPIVKHEPDAETPKCNSADEESPVKADGLQHGDKTATLLATLVDKLMAKSGSSGSEESPAKPNAAPSIEVELPVVTISEEPILANGKTIKSWEHPAGEKAMRVTCPLNGGKLYKTFSFDFEEFQKWLPRHTKVKNAISIGATCGNLERLFQLLTFPHDTDPKGLLCQCLAGNIITELRELPIMSKIYSWPKTIMSALDHYIQFLAMKCNQARPRQTETRLTLLQLSEEVVQGFKGEDTDQRAKQGSAKKRRDTERLTNQWPSTELIKNAVKQAMVDLAYVVGMYAGDPKELALMNKLIVGITHYNEFAGRSHEWAILSASHCQTQFRDGKHVLVCQEHKTAQVYGDVGKYLSPGTLQAMKIYDSAFQGDHPRTSDLFFQPCGGKHVSISYYLRKFGQDNFPGLPAPNSNLLRKQFASVTDRHAKQNKCFQMMEAYDKHGAQTQKKSYICTSAEQDAEYGQYIFKEVYGDPVAWPTPEEMKAMTRKVCFEDVAGQEACSEVDEQDPSEGDECESDDVSSAGPGEDSSEKEDVGADGANSTIDLPVGLLEAEQADAEAAVAMMPLGVIWDECDDESKSLHDDLYTSMVLQSTINDYTDVDSLDFAASMASHIAECDAATRNFARADPSTSRDWGEMMQSIMPLPVMVHVAAPVTTAPVATTPNPDSSPTAGKGRAKGMGKGKSAAEKAHYVKYEPPLAGLRMKTFVSDAAHKWMDDQLKAWQIESGASAWQRPIQNKWYWDKRVEAINANILSTAHSWDVVRSWLKLQTKQLEAAAVENVD